MIVKSCLGRGWEWKIGGCIALVVALSIGGSEDVLAQIVPDKTLGAEGSVVKPNVNMQGIPSDRIDGGATRGTNLFHSFRDFNVGKGRGAYFANPIGIENILTRVTGSNASNILGRLGVLGGANLFLLNPNGIIFGANASLDIKGSFVATTAKRIQLGDSGYFSAVEPQTSSLLSVSPGALFFSQVANQPTAIINQGNLSTGKHLTLSAGNLDLQGQLFSGGDLTLQATDTVKVRDSVTSPFLARSDGNLTIVGNGGIDILALNHPTQTPFASGGNLSLISDGIISGDARFSSGGSFSIKSVSGGLANFVSLYDPIISANGNVDVAANYTGASLLVEATGNIRFQSNINITRPDTSTLPADPDTAILSTTSALIMRSGQSNLAYGGVNSDTVPAYSTETVPGGITIGGNVTLEPFNGSGGIVNLLAASRNVSTQSMTTNGGTIRLKATDGSISTGDLYSNSSSNSGNAEVGGAINLEATNGSISTGFLGSFSSSNSGNAGEGGAINLKATNGSISTGYLNSKSSSNSGNAEVGGAINLEAIGGRISTGYLDSGSSSNSGNAKEGGRINLEATNGSISTGYLYSNSSSYGNAGEGGAINLEATNGSISTDFLGSFSSSYSGNAGEGGTINLEAIGGGISTGYLNSKSSSNSGNAEVGGAINLEATDSISTGYLDSGSSSNYGNAGEGGAIKLEATNSISTGYLYSNSSSYGNAGEGGAINLEATNGNISTGFLGSFSSSYSGNAKEGGAINLKASNGISTDYLNSNSYSNYGNAGVGGAIKLEATNGSISTGNLYSNSYSSNYGNAGVGGAINLEATNGSISTGDLYSFSYSNYGNAGVGGAINLFATNTIQLLRYQYNPDTNTFKLVPGSGSINSTGKLGSGNITITSYAPLAYDNGIITSDTFGPGKGGDILISAPAITLSGGAQLSASTHSSGLGGNINLRTSNKVELTGATTDAPEGIFSSPSGFSAIPPGTYLGGYIPNGDLNNFPKDDYGNLIPPPGTQFPSGVFSQTTVGSTGSAGNLRIETGQLNINNGAAIATTTFGEGNAGNIWAQAYDSISVANGSILSGVAGGAIGNSSNIDLSTRSLSIATGGTVQTQTLGRGKAGNIQVNANDAVRISGINPTSHTPSGLRSGSGGSNTLLGTASNNIGQGGDIYVTTDNLSVLDGGVLDAQTLTNSRGGDITLNANTLSGINGGRISATATEKATSTARGGNIEVNSSLVNLQGDNSGLFAQTEGAAPAGSLILHPNNGQSLRVNLQDNAQISASTFGSGQGGSLSIEAPQAVTISGNGQLSVETSGTGVGGNLTIKTQELTIQDGTQVSASTSSTNPNGVGGNITINATESLDLSNGVRLLAKSNSAPPSGNVTINTGNLTARNGTIATSSEKSSGGGITITASKIRLFGDSDITTNVNQGAGGGGNIYLKGDSILAFDDSDILTYAQDGKGGNITLDTPAFFGENYRLATRNTVLNTLDRNNQVDINATGAVSGVITIRDVSFIPNSLTELPENQINTDSLLANSCIVRRNQPTKGTFRITGTGGLPQRPGDAQMSSFPTVDVKTLPSDSTLSKTNPNPSWQKSDPIVEPQGVYRLPNGKLVLSRECS
ncbi:MAG: filamentous hemagglutinin N-terminal domain-containing protein [Nostoc sp.]|uniref:two-partner secretion domain-containing protein n=1 Tax=Nostoc sp. TaxID=1180 RepID=UPI002FFD3D92